MKPSQISAALEAQIIAAIRAGTHPHIAAESAGMPAGMFERLRHGPGRDARFAALVREARAQARARAEAEVFQKSPLQWLLHGPGRDRPGRPGWAATVKPNEKKPPRANFLADPVVVTFLRSLQDLLAPYPEARAALAAKLYALPVHNAKSIPSSRSKS